MAGKCPKCEEVVVAAKLSKMESSDGVLRLKTLSITCPSCDTIIGVIVDPLPLENLINKRR